MPAASPGFDADLSSGDLTPTSGTITSIAFTLQRLGRRLKTHLGESLTDRFAGIDWLAWSQIMPVGLPMMVGFIREQCDTCPGIARTESLDGTFNHATFAATFTGVVAVEATGQTAALTLTVGNSNGNPALLLLLLQPSAVFP